MKKKGVALKLFAGFLINPELRMHLKSSPEWKEYSITKETRENNLEQVQFEGQAYLGIYLDPPQIDPKQVIKIEEGINALILKLFPKYSLKELPLYFFSQAFIE